MSGHVKKTGDEPSSGLKKTPIESACLRMPVCLFSGNCMYLHPFVDEDTEINT